MENDSSSSQVSRNFSISVIEAVYLESLFEGDDIVTSGNIQIDPPLEIGMTEDEFYKYAYAAIEDISTEEMSELVVDKLSREMPERERCTEDADIPLCIDCMMPYPRR